MTDWMQRGLKDYDSIGRRFHGYGIGLIGFGAGVRFARAFAPSALMPVFISLVGLILMCVAYYRAVERGSE